MVNIEKRIEENPVLLEVQNVLHEQTRKGIEKYGATVQYGNLSAAEWIQHAKEETADKLVYLTCLEKSLQDLETKGNTFDEIGGILNDLEYAGTLSESMALEEIKRVMYKAFRNGGESND